MLCLRTLPALTILAALLGPTASPAHAAPSDVALVRVEKAARTITLYNEAGQPLRVYSGIQLGFQPTGPKRVEGDGRTPEGHYTIDYGNDASGYQLSLHISYPNAADRARAAAAGRAPGGAIFIHGQPNYHQNGRILGDWTVGCIAVSDAEIEQLWALVPDGTPIELVP